MGRLVDDENVRVRQTFYRMVCTWIEHLPERYDYETLIMPYVLSALCDSVPDIQTLAQDCLERLGSTYEDDRADELRDQLQYGKALEAQHRAAVAGLPTVLPAPFKQRPRLGSRIIVERFVPRLMSAILAELVDWKSKTRLRATTLLRSLMVYAEADMAPHTAALWSTLVKPSVWHDVSIRAALVDCARLLAEHVIPANTLGLLCPMLAIDESLEDASAMSDRCACVLEIVCEVLTCTPGVSKGVEGQLLRALEVCVLADSFSARNITF